MTALAEVFDKEITETLFSVYWKVLEPFRDDESIQALNKCLTSCRFFPKPADLLESLQGKEEDRATQAWEIVDRAMRTQGNYVSVDFGDSRIHQAIEMLGGWSYLGTITEDEWKWKRKEFESAYRALQGNGGLDHVSGLIEQENAPRGYKVPTPRRIGTPRKRLLQ
jgi:hypothetical protein